MLGFLESGHAVDATQAGGKAKLMFSLGELVPLSEFLLPAMEHIAACWVFAWCFPTCVGDDVCAQSRQRESLCWGGCWCFSTCQLPPA